MTTAWRSATSSPPTDPPEGPQLPAPGRVGIGDGAHRGSSWCDRCGDRRGSHDCGVVQRRRRAGSRAPSERRADHDRRPDGARHVRAAVRAPGDRGAGRDLPQLVRLLSPLLPLARHDAHRPLQPQPRRGEQPPAERGLRQARQGEHSAGVAPAPRIHDRPYRQVPERLWPDRRRPARVDRVVRLDRSHDLQDVGLHAERERHLQDLRQPGGGGPRALPDRRLPPEGRGLHQAPLRSGEPVLPVGRVPGPALRGAGGATGGRPIGAPGAAPQGPIRQQAAATPALVQRARRVRQAALHPQPGAADRPAAAGHDHHQLPGAPGGAALGGRSGARDRGRAALHRRAVEHLRGVHLRQRLLPRRAPGAQRQAARLRALEPRPAAHPRPRHQGRPLHAARWPSTPTSPPRCST